ncbi:MAG TPA: ABC transporter permease [Gaiellaceae bacterium]|jgi:peptide/nickel transport system permease protein|nr:ABC transporter permease [Gaiellaceae bacterium]
MARFLARRLVLALVTLWVLSVVIFTTTSVLPGDVGRRILGPFADQRAVDALNEELGTDRPLLTQYLDWMGGILQGDLGMSLAFDRPVSEILFPAFENSLKLALVAFVLVVPLGILGGVVAALWEGKLADRFLSLGGLSATAIPEFVWAVVVILVFGLWLDLLPVTAQAPQGADPLTELRYLLLPALCLVFVLFGYIARMARAGTIESLDSDYTRTAVLKGLPRRTVVRRHVLRNSLLPTIAVVATQVGYLLGGLVAIELIFGYQGIGQLIFRAAEKRDFPVLESAVLLVGVTYLVATLVADLLYAVLNPRIRHREAQ